MVNENLVKDVVKEPYKYGFVSDIFYEQLESTSKKLSTFSKKIGKSIEDLEIDDLVLLVEQRLILFYLNDPEEKIYFC